jgi:acid stress chaperone HdeB
MKPVFILAAATLFTVAARADTLDLRTLNCGDFAKASGQDKTTVAVWLNGYYMGNDDEAIINFDKVNTLGNALVKYCADHAASSVADAAEQVLGNRRSS